MVDEQRPAGCLLRRRNIRSLYYIHYIYYSQTKGYTAVGFGLHDLKFRMWGAGCRVLVEDLLQDLGSEVSGLGFPGSV